MQNKNMIVAIVLCLAIMFGWAPFAEHMGWMRPLQQEREARQNEALEEQKAQLAAREASEREAEKARLLPAFVPSAGQDVSVETPLFAATVYSGGGILRSFGLKNFHQSISPDSTPINLISQATAAVAPLGLLVNGQPSWSTGKWQFEGGNLSLADGRSGTLVLTGEADAIRIRRELTFSADSYIIKEKLTLLTTGDSPRSVRMGYTVAADSTGMSEGPYDSMRVAWYKDGKLGEESDKSDLEKTGVVETGAMSWAGVMNTYFMSAILPAEGQTMTVKGRLQNGVYRAALEQQDLLLVPGQEKEISVSYWIGPKERSLLHGMPNHLETSIDLGMFSMIAKGLLWLLDFFQQYVHNWGISIILLTILIKALFWPLTAKSYSSMEKMKKLQPLMKAIREKHKDDKEALNKEVMNLYKTYKVNPASGCVPILVQLPVFFGLYQALLTSIELRHASFITFLPGTDIVWLADLASKDPLYLTPVIMGLTMFLQQKMSPPVGDPMQQKIMMFLPVIFTVMFLGFPSGLVIYWLVNNVLSIAQQYLMIRKSKRNAANAT